MGKYGKTGVDKDTPKNIMFGAGTIHKNLKYTSTWNFDESIIGATSGGSKISIVPEFVDVEADGVLVPTKGLKVKVGEKAEMEINFVELTEELVKSAIVGADGSSKDSNFKLIETKADLADTDYFENIAFVGKTLAGKDIIVIMDNALCVSGFESQSENKKEGVGTYTFASHADLNGNVDKLPVHIYYPTAVV